MNWSQFIRDASAVATAFNTFQANKKLDTLNESLNDFKNQTNAELGKLNETVQKGFAMLSLELAVQSDIFRNVLSVLKEKRKTEAEELKNFGLSALRNGWINDAIDDFNKSLEYNRYDYQVYYLLSKCYFAINDEEMQNTFLQKSFQYSAEDPLFRQYIGLDIVGQLVKEKNYDEAKDVIHFLETLIDDSVNHPPLMMCKILIHVAKKEVNKDTIDLIDKAIDNYNGEEPSRIITVIQALCSLLPDDQKLLVQNRLNLKKFVIAKKYGVNVVTYIENAEKILNYATVNADKDSILKLAPNSVLNEYLPLYDSIPSILNKITQFKNRISKISIDDYEKFTFIAPIIKSVENGILDDINKVYKKTEGGDFNTRPFDQSILPELDFNVGNGDKILVQSKLDGGGLITLTYFKLIIVTKDKLTYEYNLVEDFLNVVNEEIRLDDLRANDKLVDKITFYLRDKLSERILLFASSSFYTEKYGSNSKHANVLRLLWSRAVNNILIYLQFKSFNNHLSTLDSCIDFIGVNSESNETGNQQLNSKNLEVSNSDDVEFL
jgi:hypothetical protein